MEKRDIPQAVFDSPEARQVQRDGHRRACEELARTHPTRLDPSNPNHPIHSGIFGYDVADFLRKQY